jgi:hypothetical protein
VTVKERLHNAVETMTDAEASAALRTLADASGDPVAWMLDHAPLDDEPETDEGAERSPRPTLTASGESSRCLSRACSPSSTAIGERAVLAHRR